jgi:hypothetical protein
LMNSFINKIWNFFFPSSSKLDSAFKLSIKLV